MQASCAAATQFVAARGEPAGEHGAPLDARRRESLWVHDLKNKISGVKYGCAFLRDAPDPRCAALQRKVGRIEEAFEQMLTAIDALREPKNAAPPPPRKSAAPPCAEAATVPLSTVPLSAVPDAQPAPTAATVVPAGQFDVTGHILVVDDEERQRNYLQRQLEMMGHRVTLVSDGQAALEAIEHACYGDCENAIDLVLLDLHMPGISGFEVLQTLKRDYCLRTVPVVMVSAENEIDRVVECIAAGADDYLPKLCDERLLRARASACLAKGLLSKQERLLTSQIRASKARNDRLLFEIFPYTVAEELITSGTVKPRGCEQVAVLFCDVVGFTRHCKGLSAEVVVSHLHDLFSRYEEAVDACKMERIKTIGDCLMLTAGITRHFENPVESCLRCAELLVAAARQSPAAVNGVRIGIHVGPVVAGMAGNRHYAFDVWGDTVNTASRVQGTAEPNAIHLSEPAWAQVYESCRGHSIGRRELKNRGGMEIFRFEGFRPSGAAACPATLPKPRAAKPTKPKRRP
jgi:class 3 adenylate cyclase